MPATPAEAKALPASALVLTAAIAAVFQHTCLPGTDEQVHATVLVVAAAVGMPDAVASAASLTNFRCCSLLSCLTEAATGVWWLTIGIWQTGHHDI